VFTIDLAKLLLCDRSVYLVVLTASFWTDGWRGDRALVAAAPA
jgi:hypothetical protein